MIKLFLNSDYKALRVKFDEVISEFQSSGISVFNGDRNVIKKFEIDGVYYNIKSFKKPNAFNSFIYKYVRASKAKRSFTYALKLINLGVNTPHPVGYAEELTLGGLKRSYYICKHIDYDLDFRVLNHNPKYPDRDLILSEFAKFTFKLHENGVNFLDHSPGNTLIKKTSEFEYSFYLIDLNRMLFQPMPFNKRMENFRRLWLSKHMIKVMSATYAKLYGKSETEVLSLMAKYSKAFQNKVNLKKLKKRAKRKFN